MSASGNWRITLATPMGPQEMNATLQVDGEVLTGRMESPIGSEEINGTANGDKLAWTAKVTKPIPLDLTFDVKVEGDTLSGSVKLGMFGNAGLAGQRV
ncbi:MAG TPA: hypothetical protein VF463_01420 [Sphingobium sp.]